MQIQSNYMKYRGKCKEMVNAAVLADPTLRAVRGYYHCPLWGKQEHWWAEKPDGTIVDPTAKQFPSGGLGEYEEFDGVLHCSECGKQIKEEFATFYGNYCFCSTKCNMRFVGL